MPVVPALPVSGAVHGSIGLRVSFDPPQRQTPVGITYWRPDGTQGHAVASRSPWLVAFTYAGQHVRVRASQLADGVLTCEVLLNRRVVVRDETKRHDLVDCDYAPVGGGNEAARGGG